VVSTALMAGLALTSHTSKAYAQKNCGSGSGVSVVRGNEPIVCGKGDGTRILNSSGGDININMDMGGGSGEAIKITGPNTNITIMKKLTVKGSRGSGKPVIKVLSGGALTLDQEVNVEGAGEMKKTIVVEGGNSSVMLNGVLKGFEGMEMGINNGGG
uniref:hypothetical protein n=1 Tax=Bartonella bovis TaxID=155194 RepID=UPI001957A5CE